MWNGLWKLTVMVGVIGVGLFAAFKAQQGMNQSPVIATSDRDVGDGEADTPDSSPKKRSSTDQFPTGTDEASEIFASSEPRIRANPKPKGTNAESAIDLLGNFTDDEPTVKVAAGSNKSSSRIVSVKQSRNQTSGFDDDEEPTGGKALQSERANERLTEQTATNQSTVKSRGTVRQVNAVVSDDATTSGDTEPNPFDTDIRTTETGTPTTPESIESSKPDSPNLESLEEPGRARLTTKSAVDSSPPRSERARKNALRRNDQTLESDPNPFESDSPPPGQPLAAPQTPRTETAPQTTRTENATTLGVPEPLDAPTDNSPGNRGEPSSPTGRRELPAETTNQLSDDEVPLRSSPRRPRSTVPAPLPSDSNSDLLGEPSPQSRDLKLRRSEYDRVMPMDMVGDGLAGEVSQRGLQQPRLTIEKVAQQQAVLDQPLIYTIIVKNAGSVDAHNIVVEDRIPKGTELLGTSPQAELSGKQLSWKHPMLKPNEEKRISIKVIPKQEGPIGSVARVYFATEVTAEIVVTAPQLEFTVKAPSEVKVGQRFDMVFQLKNIGKVDANNIIVRDLVPDQLKHEAGTDIECPIGKMAPQDVKEIVLPVIAMKTGSVVNKAVLTADSGVKKVLDSSIDIVGEVLVLTRTGQNRLYVERPAVFTNNVRNDGNQRADRVRISEVVPAGMEFETASDGGKYDSNLRAVVWTLGPLSPGNDKSVTVKYVPRQTGTLSGKITATGNGGSNAAVDSMVDVIGKPVLQMETLTATGVVTVGDQITSRFQLNNTGTAPANNVQLRVKLPRELRLVSAKGSNYKVRDDYLLFDIIDELGPNKKAAYELVLEPTAEADAQIGLEISADHLTRPGRRVETIQIARDALK